MSLNRPVVSVFSSEKDNEVVDSIPLPEVYQAPIRPDIVSTIHKYCLMNLRHPYAISAGTGHQTSAESWGTGRAVARIPRVAGGGTHRSGQGAFGNMCRGGRMFAPTKTWRIWAHKINKQEKRFAFASAIAATGVTAIVMARGHKVEATREIPLVVSDDIQAYTQTKKAFAFLKRVKAGADLQKVKNSRKLRAGKGKNRNRRWRQRLGPLIIYKENKGLVKAFRNIPGVDTVSINRLNLLKLAPGGQLGRFCIWTASAFKELNTIFGGYEGKSGSSKLYRRSGATYRLPRPIMSNSDLGRITESDEVQNVVRPRNWQVVKKKQPKRLNPLKNFKQMVKLNPLALVQKRRELLSKVAIEKLGKELPDAKADKRKKFAERVRAATQKFNDTIIAPVLTQ